MRKVLSLVLVLSLPAHATLFCNKWYRALTKGGETALNLAEKNNTNNYGAKPYLLIAHLLDASGDPARANGFYDNAEYWLDGGHYTKLKVAPRAFYEYTGWPVFQLKYNGKRAYLIPHKIGGLEHLKAWQVAKLIGAERAVLPAVTNRFGAIDGILVAHPKQFNKTSTARSDTLLNFLDVIYMNRFPKKRLQVSKDRQVYGFLDGAFQKRLETDGTFNRILNDPAAHHPGDYVLQQIRNLKEEHILALAVPNTDVNESTLKEVYQRLKKSEELYSAHDRFMKGELTLEEIEKFIGTNPYARSYEDYIPKPVREYWQLPQGHSTTVLSKHFDQGGLRQIDLRRMAMEAVLDGQLTLQKPVDYMEGIHEDVRLGYSPLITRLASEGRWGEIEQMIENNEGKLPYWMIDHILVRSSTRLRELFLTKYGDKITDELRRSWATTALHMNIAPIEVIDAHKVGQGEEGRDGSPAGYKNYTDDQLQRKYNILAEAGLNKSQIKKLMDLGIVGDPPKADPTSDNFYKRLGLEEGADSEAIAKAYRKLAVKYHPDNAETGDAQFFKKVHEAYETLNDSETRAEYDTNPKKPSQNDADIQQAYDELKRKAERRYDEAYNRYRDPTYGMAPGVYVTPGPRSMPNRASIFAAVVEEYSRSSEPKYRTAAEMLRLSQE